MRLPQQPYSLRSILADALPVYIADSEEVLSIGIALVSGELAPLDGFGIVLRYTITIIIAVSEAVLSIGISLISG